MQPQIFFCETWEFFGEKHTYNGPFTGTTQVSRYQKGKTDLDFTETTDSEWQWHQLGHMQVCTSLQTNNHASQITTLSFTGRMSFLPPNQQCQSTEGKCLRMLQTFNNLFLYRCCENFKNVIYKYSITYNFICLLVTDN